MVASMASTSALIPVPSLDRVQRLGFMGLGFRGLRFRVGTLDVCF